MKKILVGSTLMTLSYIGFTPIANAQECGTVTIASMNWQSAEVLASIDKFILEKGLGCAAETTIGDTVPTITSMAEKGPAGHRS